MTESRNKWSVVYFNVALACVLLVGLEVGGQFAYFLVKGYPLYERQRHVILETDDNPFEVHPFMAGRLKSNLRVTQNGKTITSTDAHTRWTGARADDTGTVRVALLGGSTTFGTGVTDAETWPARLQAMLGPAYSVTNYGVPGYSSAESIIQLALVVPENRPDIVVLYEGWNDIHNYHESQLGSDYYAHGLKQYSNLAIQRPQPEGLIAKLAEFSALCHLAQTISKKLHVADASRVVPTNAAYPVPDPSADPAPDSFVDRVYVRNLKTQKTLGRQLGAFVFFVPQVLDASRFTGSSGSAWTPHVRSDAMPRLIDRLNGFMRKVCPPSDAECAVLNDVTAHPWGPDDFIDEGHFSQKGNVAFARLLAAHIEALHRRPFVMAASAHP